MEERDLKIRELRPEETELLKEISGHLTDMQNALTALKKEEAAASSMKSGKEQALYYKDHVTAAMKDLRTPVDALEMLVDKDIWPIPTYGQLMFEV